MKIIDAIIIIIIYGTAWAILSVLLGGLTFWGRILIGAL